MAGVNIVSDDHYNACILDPACSTLQQVAVQSVVHIDAFTDILLNSNTNPFQYSVININVFNFINLYECFCNILIFKI